jgi:hypothetical protein
MPRAAARFHRDFDVYQKTPENLRYAASAKSSIYAATLYVANNSRYLPQTVQQSEHANTEKIVL